jgi:hypothetical protein
MQQVQQHQSVGLPQGSERMSWARAMIFAVGFFLIAAILIGQLPSTIYAYMTASTLSNFEQVCLGIGVVCIASFVVILVILLLFDPKPLLPPAIFVGLGPILAIAGLALTIWSTTTGCTPAVGRNYAAVTCNQYFPSASTSILPMLGGKFLWFQPNAIDFSMLGLVIMGVGLAMLFYGSLALGELRNPDRRDLGTTPAIRWMIVGSILLLILFLFVYNFGFVYDSTNKFATLGITSSIFPKRPFVAFKLSQLLVSILLGVAVLLALGAFALRLHYLMRPIRKRTMSVLYAVGAIGLAQTGAIFIVLWIVAYPLLALIHPWTFIGLGHFLTVCTTTDVPASCSYSQDAGYIMDAIITSNFFLAVVAAVWAWKSHRYLVIISSVLIIAVAGILALVLHTAGAYWATALMVCVAVLVVAVIMTSVSRREFAVVGEQNLGCLGMWLVVGTSLFIYLAGFAFFSMPNFGDAETPPNVGFIPGQASDAFVMFILLGVLAGIQFFFLARNRYKA